MCMINLTIRTGAWVRTRKTSFDDVTAATGTEVKTAAVVR